MALKGDKELSNGVVATYHHINGFMWKKDLKLSILIASFLDEKSYLEKKEPVCVSNFEFNDIPSDFDFNLKNLYAKIKELSDFSELKDI